MMNVQKPLIPTTTETLVKTMIDIFKQHPDVNHFILNARAPFEASFNGVVVVYQQDGKFHAQFFTGDDKPLTNRDAASFIVARSRDNSLRLIVYPAYLEFIGPLA